MNLDDVFKFLNENEVDPSYYMEEGCGIYAMALSHVKPGGQIYIMSNKDGEAWSKSIPYEVTHVVYHIDGKTYDATGITTAQKVARIFHIEGTNTIKGPFAPDEFFRKFMGNSDTKPLYGTQKDIAEAVEIIKQQEVFTESSMGSNIHAYWFDSKTNSKVQVPVGNIHYLLVKQNPEKFGLSLDQVKDLSDEGVFKLMGDNGWIRCNIQKEYIAVSGSMNNEIAVRKAIGNALKTESFERAHIDLYGEKRDITGSYVETYIALKNPEQIKAYVKTGNKLNALKEAAAVYASSLPQVYKDLPKLGKGMTSIVLDKGDGTVLMFTRAAIKHEWLTRPWGIEIGKTVDELTLPHKRMEVRNMPVYVVELPKLYKLDSKNKALLKKELENWNKIYRSFGMGNHRTRFIDDANKFIDEHPDSILVPILEFMMNYDNVGFDVAFRNTMQDAQGNIVFIDPLVDGELLSYLRGYK